MGNGEIRILWEVYRTFVAFSTSSPLLTCFQKMIALLSCHNFDKHTLKDVSCLYIYLLEIILPLFYSYKTINRSFITIIGEIDLVKLSMSVRRRPSWASVIPDWPLLVLLPPYSVKHIFNCNKLTPFMNIK